MNQDRYKEIYNCYHPLVFKIILAMTKDRQAAEDLAQDTFFALYLQGTEKFRDTAKMKYWLIKSATHKTYDYLKRNRKIIPVSVDFFHELSVKENLYLKVEEAELVTALYRAIDRLTEEQKAIVILYYFNQIPQAEIAETLKIPRGTVKSRLHKARLLLKLRLLNEYVAVTGTRKEEA
jgi:RNA polymerase sigma-70 factor (ECF subfamily)